MTLSSNPGSVYPTELPKVSVVIPIYNGEADLPGLLNCLQVQTYPVERVEYLLVDNGSRDRTATLIQQAAETGQAAGWQIRLLNENRIQSSYAARNAGIRTAQSEIVAFTDADCRPQPQWLQTLVQPFVDPAVGVVVGEVLALPSKTLLEKHAERQTTLSQKHTLAHPFYPYGQTANLAVRYSIFQQVGLFRPYLTTGGDADLCWRIQQQSNWQFYFAEQAVVQHRHRPTLRELQSQWRRYGHSNRYLHELHGVDLMRELTWRESAYRLSRWLIKEIPLTAARAIAGKATMVDLLNTPISLVNAQARTKGQREARLPEIAQQIEWLQPSPAASANPLPLE